MLRKLLLRYNIKDFKFSDSGSARSLLKYLVHRDISSSFPDTLRFQKQIIKDALQIIDLYNHFDPWNEVWLERVQYLCINRFYDQAVQVLQILEHNSLYTNIESAPTENKPTASDMSDINISGNELNDMQRSLFYKANDALWIIIQILTWCDYTARSSTEPNMNCPNVAKVG